MTSPTTIGATSGRRWRWGGCHGGGDAGGGGLGEAMADIVVAFFRGEQPG
jgi:hypothetical protein